VNGVVVNINFEAIDNLIKGNSSFWGLAIILLGIFIALFGALVHLKFEKNTSGKVEEIFSNGYEGLISNVEYISGDYSRSLEPINFVYHEGVFFVVSNYHDIENPEKSQIRVDAFNHEGKWVKEFGGANTGYRVVDTGFNKSIPKEIFLTSDLQLGVLGEAKSKPGGSQAFIVVLGLDGRNSDSFNGGVVKSIKYKEQPVSSCYSAVSKHGKIFLACSGIEEIGIGVIAIKSNGELDLSYGESGVSEKLTSPLSEEVNITMADYDALSNGLYILGKLNGRGLLIKYDSKGRVSKNYGNDGKSEISSGLPYNGFMNQVNSFAILPDGTTVTVGAANNGFGVALDYTGDVNNNIGVSGVIDVRSFYRATSNSISILSDSNIVIGGVESDGNSISNGIVSFYGRYGKPQEINGRLSVHIRPGIPTEVIDLLFDDQNRLFALARHKATGAGFSVFNIFEISF